jgi:aspartyl-tRNA(Asn)/glutamyl-tRNA(Gln) amidotransferase subunit B
MSSEWEAVIGLEVHAQLSTESKIFCRCRARLEEGHSVAGEVPNANTCPICTGHPGTLPVLNEQAVAFAIKAGLAIGCEIKKKSIFARKNYFYPDLPKGYQISQYDQPVCENGTLPIELADGTKKKIRVQRIHLEEDAGKNVHMTGYSLVNLNRAGMPLIEIVSHPDLNTPEEAGAYLRALHAIVTYLDICDGNMQEGNFRCDANVSVRPKGTTTLGTRAEIKNVNSFRFVEKAIEYEVNRQIGVIQGGGKVVQETRLYDSAKNVTLSMRSKEDAHDYRYFPEPDLLPVMVDKAWIEKLKKELPELPQQRRQRYMADYALPAIDAQSLTASKPLAVFFEQTLELLKNPKSQAKTTANLLTGEVTRLLNEESIELGRSRLKPQHLADLAGLLSDQVVSSTGAKQALTQAWKTGDSIAKIVEKEGLKQVSDTGALEPVLDDIIARHPAQVAEFRSGKDKVMGFFVGQAMKATGGKANPSLLQDLLLKKLKN